jgi:hypothetical protein
MHNLVFKFQVALLIIINLKYPNLKSQKLNKILMFLYVIFYGKLFN